MADKENKVPGTGLTQPTITQKYKSVKRKLTASETENKRLKTELTESNAKVEIIQNSEVFKELTDIAQNLVPPIPDVFAALVPPPVLAGIPCPENRVVLSPLKDRTHPLEVDVVLREVFSYLSGEDLAASRLVSRIWNSNAGNGFKQTHNPVFLRNSRTIGKFVKIMENSTDFPFTKFLIKNEFGPRFESQFQKFGHHIKTLTLTRKKNMRWNGVNPTHIHDITLSNVLNILRLTPHLETLELSGLQFTVGYVQPEGFGQVRIGSLKNLTLRIDDSELSPTPKNAEAVLLTLRRIFSAAPELSSLKLQVYGRDLLSVILPVVEQIPTLRNLEFESCLAESHLEHLTGTVLRLTSLKMVVHLADCRLFQEFITTQASTLRRLELYFPRSGNTRPLPSVTFPVFPNLTYFKFISVFNDSGHLHFNRQEKGNEFPVLKELWTTSEVLSHYFPTRLPVHAVVSLTCEYIRKPEYARTYTGLPGVKESFPNVAKIHVKSPTERCTKLILANTADFLEHLAIDNTGGDQTNIDGILTGVPQSSWLTGEFQQLASKPLLVRRIVTNFFRDTPNIQLHGMKKLKSLEIRCSDDSRFTLTDVSGYITLSSLHSLEYLAIYNSKLSEDCIEELRRIHKTVYVKTLSKEEQKAYRSEHIYH